MNFITGEKIQFLCDHFIGHKKDFRFNPNVNKNYKDKCINIESINDVINNKLLIFCYTHLIDKLDFLISGIWGNRFSPEVRNYKSIARQTKDRIKLDPLEIQILITGHKIKGDVLTAKLFTNYEVYTKKQQSI